MFINGLLSSCFQHTDINFVLPVVQVSAMHLHLLNIVLRDVLYTN